ncbi:MAG: hypothetical protein RLZZ228_582 [Actinomycetota bacterium]|jgi:pimeloyl-ACP methyl ester carboxylesterase
MPARVAQVIGSGPQRVLALHGWFGPSVYEGFFDLLDPQHYQVAVLHNPAYGTARDNAPAADITDLAQQQLAAADELGWNTFDVIGHSYGGAAGLRMATLAPERVNAVVGICPVMPTGFDAIAVANTGATEETGPAYLAAYSKGKAEDGPGMIIAGLDPVLAADPVAFDNLLDATLTVMDEQAYKQYFLVWTGASFADDVIGLATPSLFIVGEHDPFAMINYVTPTQESMAPGAVTIETLPGGHFLTVSGDRSVLVAMIDAFLRTTD